jgi:serine-protein kinase ATM
MSQLFEVKTLRESFQVSRDLEGSQEALKSAISLSKLVKPCSALGISIEGAAKFDMANVLWDQGEMTTSISMLQQLNEQGDLQKEALLVSRAEVLASLVCTFFIYICFFPLSQKFPPLFFFERQELMVGI